MGPGNLVIPRYSIPLWNVMLGNQNSEEDYRRVVDRVEWGEMMCVLEVRDFTLRVLSPRGMTGWVHQTDLGEV